jgi:hypothetical protein
MMSLIFWIKFDLVVIVLSRNEIDLDDFQKVDYFNIKIEENEQIFKLRVKSSRFITISLITIDLVFLFRLIFTS